MNQTEEYFKYIEEHRSNVRKAWGKIKPLVSQGNYDNLIMEKIIASHDLSKYSDEEFVAYRKRFFPYEKEVYYESEFEDAWQHHKDNNPHHWENMLATNYENPNIYEHTLEMICDWYAMAIKFKEGHRDYYNKKKDEIQLQEWQRELIEFVYDKLDDCK
jgi:hypothetical protein